VARSGAAVPVRYHSPLPTEDQAREEPPLARAKKTDRAEARRRHRAQVADETGASASGQTGAASPSGSGTGAPPPGGLFGGILSSIKRPDVLADLRAAPAVLLARPWILAPFGLVIVGAVLAATGNMASGSIEATAVALLLAQPTLLYFVVGYLAPRGSYIFGAVLGLFAAVLYVVIVLNKLGPDVAGGDITSGALSYVLIQVMSGALFAGFASWYRSFLRTAGERNRQRSEERRRAEQREQRRTASKPAASPKPQSQPAVPASPSPATQSTVQSLLNRFRPGR